MNRFIHRWCFALTLAAAVGRGHAQTTPFATTEPAQQITGTNATLAGMATPNLSAAQAWFQWGTNQSYQYQTPPTGVGSGKNVVWVTNQLAGLIPGQSYHFRLVVSNSLGTAFGSDKIFGAGKVLAWGANDSQQTNVPAGLNNAAMIAAGYNQSLALKTDGAVVGWGYTNGAYNPPASLTNILAVDSSGTSGGYFSVALKSDRTVLGWGDNNFGHISIPASITNAVVMKAWDYGGIILRPDGTTTGWGYQYSDYPGGLSNIVDVAGGDLYYLALKNDGTVVAWGNNGGGGLNVPAGLTNVVSIAAGWANSSIALKSDGTVVVWGLGINTNVPANVTNLVAIAAGNALFLGLRGDGSVVGWGASSSGETNIPPGVTNATAVAAGINWAMALQAYAPSVTNLIVSPANPTIGAGSNVQFSATEYFDDGSVLVVTNGGINPLWSSSVPVVASITTNGVATGLAAGTSLISATVGSVSGSTMLTVLTAPNISVQPTNSSVSPNSSVTLQVDASGGGLSYQWQLDGTNIIGATGATYTITNVTATNVGVYTVVVSNAVGSTTSQAAIVGTTDIQMFAGVIVNGPVGSNYIIQSTSNLLNGWTTRTNLALPMQPYIYIDYSSPTNPQQFYRAMPQ